LAIATSIDLPESFYAFQPDDANAAALGVNGQIRPERASDDEWPLPVKRRRKDGHEDAHRSRPSVHGSGRENGQGHLIVVPGT
jgi:hypothetical protein